MLFVFMHELFDLRVFTISLREEIYSSFFEFCGTLEMHDLFSMDVKQPEKWNFQMNYWTHSMK